MVIRPKQCQLAMHLLQLEQKEQEQIVTQLNMGEGKTSVILPIMALYLSNGIDRLSRIIVLRSLFPTNLSTLHSLFGILGRCVLSLPCNRATKLDANKIYDLLETTLKNRGTIVATSDEIMSFNLRIRENSSFNNGDLNKCQEWINKNVQNIMDEADEILHPRNQLIYPTGNPFIIDGKHIRWRTCMAILEALHAIIDPIYAQYGERHIQYRKGDTNENELGFGTPYIRLIKDDCYKELSTRIVKHIVSGRCSFSYVNFVRNWTDDEQTKIIQLISSQMRIVDGSTERKENSNTGDNVEFFSSLSEFRQFLVLTLRGVLHHGCLLSVLKKRFNVDYGLPDNKRRVEKNRTEMAVPYRAKNVPSECSEFSHCDVAILVTLLSYYYNGLNESQMHNLLHSGKISQNYENWIKKLKQDKGYIVEIEKLPDKWEGVNLFDEKQQKSIGKALYNFVPAINFYCDQMVFPHYCKQFECKLSNSPWNLAEKQENYITTGFAGTNGLQSIYPISIKQNDLREEKDLNVRLDERLCKPYRDIICLDSKCTGISSENITDIPRKCNILLDCGGIVESVNNYSFAKCWLESRKPDQQAIVYFDMYKNTLQVLDLSGTIVDYETSSYKNNISKLCLVFLDQFHTRGTDLKLPKKSLACITLGTGLTRDELAQGAMRMRQLEKVLIKDARQMQDENDDCSDFKYEHEFVYLATFDVYNEIIPLKIDTNNDTVNQLEDTISTVLSQGTYRPVTNFNAKDSKLKTYLVGIQFANVWAAIDSAHERENEEIVKFEDLIGVSESDLKDIIDILELKGKIKMQFLHIVKMHINEKKYGKCDKLSCKGKTIKKIVDTMSNKSSKMHMDGSVLNWCKNNTKELINRMVPIWGNQGLLFYSQALKNIGKDKDVFFDPNYQEFEVTKLKSMYGGSFEKQNVLSVIQTSNVFHNVKYCSAGASIALQQHLKAEKKKFRDTIECHVKNMFDYSNILVFYNQESCDDEQERHLERETDAETETKRRLPRAKKSAQPGVSNNLLHVFQHGWNSNINDWNKNGLILSSDACKHVYENENKNDNENGKENDTVKNKIRRALIMKSDAQKAKEKENEQDVAQLYSPPKNWLLIFWNNDNDNDNDSEEKENKLNDNYHLFVRRSQTVSNLKNKYNDGASTLARKIESMGSDHDDVTTIGCAMFVTQHEASTIKKHENMLNQDGIGTVWSLHNICARLAEGQSMLYDEYVICQHKNCDDNNNNNNNNNKKKKQFGGKFTTLLNQHVGNLYFANENEFNLFCRYNSLCLKPYNVIEKQARNEKKISNDGFVNHHETRIRLWDKYIANEQTSRLMNESPIESIIKMISIERNYIFLKGSHMQGVIHKVQKPKFESALHTPKLRASVTS